MCVYNTALNTIGVGDPVPFSVSECGSGDLFGGIFPKAPKAPKMKAIKGIKAPKRAKFNNGPFGVIAGKPSVYGKQLPLIVRTKK